MTAKLCFQRASDTFQIGSGEPTDDGGSVTAQRVRQLGAQRQQRLCAGNPPEQDNRRARRRLGAWAAAARCSRRVQRGGGPLEQFD